MHSSLYEINFYDAILFLSLDFYVVQRNGEKEEDKEKRKYSQTAMKIICKHWIDRDFCALVSNNRRNLSVFSETWTIAK